MRLRSIGKIGLVGLLFLAFAGGSASAASCSNATLSGVYGVLDDGVDSTGHPQASVGQVTADGNGNITAASNTKSDNGSIITTTSTGTYSIAKNCAGTMALTDTGGTGHFSIVLDDGNKQFKFITTDSGKLKSGIGVAEGILICSSTGGAAETFAKSLTGSTIASGPLAIVGHMRIDGNGGLSGQDTLDVNGTISSHTYTGTYTVNPSCTGSAQVKEGGKTYNFMMVLVNGGSEGLLLETDANTIVSGTAQH
jgi:hypothetical protein